MRYWKFYATFVSLVVAVFYLFLWNQLDPNGLAPTIWFSMLSVCLYLDYKNEGTGKHFESS